MTWAGSCTASRRWRDGSPNWRPEQAAAAAELAADLASVDREAFARAVGTEARRRLKAFADGVDAYRRHPGRRTLADPPAVWGDGTTRLLDYGATAAGAQRPLLVVPSLINRGYILDLSERRSLLRYLAGRGLRPFLVEWGAPGERERRFDLTDYVAARLEGALEAVLALAGGPVGVVGYCMGGLLALALVQRRAADVACLALMATPWDFHAVGLERVRVLAALAPLVGAITESLGVLPVDVLQALFTSLDPYLTARKFQRFAAVDPGSRRAADFVALEDWLNDGVPLAAPVARQTLIGWYAENAPARGTWRIGGRPVRPADVQVPTLVIIPGRDHIVPAASAAALARALPRARRRTVAAGHIGMVAGGRAAGLLYRPLADWLDGAM